MWFRKDLKQKARGIFKKHYLRTIGVCFIMAYVAGSYNMSGSTNFATYYDVSKEAANTVNSNLHEDKKSNSDIVNDLINEGEAVEAEEDSNLEKSKYSKGVFAGIFNNVTESGSFLFGMLNALNQSIFYDNIQYGIIILIGTLIAFLAWLFVQNVMQVNECRYFIENAVYQNTSLWSLVFVIRIRKWWNAVQIMFFRALYLMLWNITIIGGIIKHYSYLMLPYIVAENPDINRKDAFKISREIMNGNKWKMFKLDLSFVGWTILSVLTLGITGILFSNPYYTAIKTELYLTLREQAIQSKINGYELFNDPYIGINPRNPEGSTEFPSTYPVALFSIPEHKRRQWIKVDYRRDYTIWSLVLLFFTFSVIGWIWEVSLHLSTDGFVNRGVLQGPWLPIYGSGGILILVLLKKVREHPFITFLLTVVVCGALEYVTSWYLEMSKGLKWWDYSGYFLNLNGRICAEGLLVFGLGGCAIIYFAAPLFDQLYKKIPVKVQIILCAFLLTIFSADLIYSYKHPNTGKGITDYGQETQISSTNIK